MVIETGKLVTALITSCYGLGWGPWNAISGLGTSHALTQNSTLPVATSVKQTVTALKPVPSASGSPPGILKRVGCHQWRSQQNQVLPIGPSPLSVCYHMLPNSRRQLGSLLSQMSSLETQLSHMGWRMLSSQWTLLPSLCSSALLPNRFIGSGFGVARPSASFLLSSPHPPPPYTPKIKHAWNYDKLGIFCRV